jgi:hypothetical protein
MFVKHPHFTVQSEHYGSLFSTFRDLTPMVSGEAITLVAIFSDLVGGQLPTSNGSDSGRGCVDGDSVVVGGCP